jgi:putative nucleotidyltransferase with HDIG domain
VRHLGARPAPLRPERGVSATRIPAALEGPAAAAVREALGETAGAWVVGGALRDALLGRPVVDLDLAVYGGEEEAARAVARASGGAAFCLSESFGAWRSIAPAGWHVDVSRLRSGSIERDLALRDFTANALAVPVAVLAGGASELVDPLGGRDDIARRWLRATGPGAFDDDPLRLLRAARIAAQLGFQIERETLALARTAAPRAGEPAGERQLAELRLLVCGSDPLRGLDLLEELRALPAVLPELEALRGVEQNPNHHLDVYGHTMQVLVGVLEIERDLERFVGAAAPEVVGLLDESLADELDRRCGLRFAALFHDLGKPAARGERGGYITFIGHDRVGAEIVRAICERLRASRRLAAYLANVTRNHLRLGFLVHRRPLDRRAVYRYLRATQPDSVDTTLLTIADRLAARGTGPVASEEVVAAHLELASEMVDEALAWRRQGPPRAPIRGDELAAELGLEPGPELGRLLEEIAAAVFAGEVTDRDEAVAFARSLVGGGSG